MKRIVGLLLVGTLCGCAGNQAERREKVGAVLFAPIAYGLWCLESKDDGPSTEEILEAQSKIHPGGRMDP